MKKFEGINQNTSTHLEGLLWAKTNHLLGLYSNGCTIESSNTEDYFARRNGVCNVPSSK